jgi:hypothetical protein
MRSTVDLSFFYKLFVERCNDDRTSLQPLNAPSRLKTKRYVAVLCYDLGFSTNINYKTNLSH